MKYTQKQQAMENKKVGEPTRVENNKAESR